MRAAMFHEAGKPLEIVSVADPVPADDQVVLAVRGAGICGSDLHVTQYPGVMPDGIILGHEFFGTIVDVGKAVTGWKAGAPVTSLPIFNCHTCDACKANMPGLCSNAHFVGNTLATPGAYAQYVAVPARFLQAIPDGVSDDEAAMVEPLAVAYHTTDRGQIKADDRVLVLGSGPIGAAVALFARAAGAKHVVVSEPAEARRERAKELGATGLIDPTTEDVSARFAALAGGAPSVVFECVGVPGMLAQAVQLAGLRARIVVAGVVFTEDSFTALTAMARELTIIYSQTYLERDFGAVIDALAHGRINAKPLHTRTVSLDELPDAFEALRNNPRECKVIIRPS